MTVNTKAIAAEFIGTFVFFSIIVIAIERQDKLRCPVPVAVSIGLLAGLLIAAPISGGHLNPAVSFMSMLDDRREVPNYALYIVAQLSAAVLVFFSVKHWLLLQDA